MRIIHTSDWHLGKSLDNVSRLEEQEKFVDDFMKIVEEKDADIVVIAGDIYDVYNPPASAEALFYKAIKGLSDNGNRCVFVISGNHDSPEKLESIRALTDKEGIVILGYPKSKARVGKYNGFEILDSSSGFTKIRKNGEVINILSLPYPSEKRLNEVLEDIDDESDMQASYSKKVGEIFSELEKKCPEDEINIAVSHLFVVGSVKSDSERRIELGGSLLVEKEDLPKKSMYTALGHIHRSQRMSKTYNAYYSGSPIQYSKTERDSVKSVYVVDLKANEEASVTKEYINNYRPIMLFKCKNIEEAFEVVAKHGEEDIFSYFEIETDSAIDLEELKSIKKGMKNVMEIKPIYKELEESYTNELVEISQLNIEEYFIDFYKKSKGIEPDKEICDLFLKFVSEVEEDEAD